MHRVSYLPIPVLVYGNNVITVVSDDNGDDKQPLTNKGTYLLLQLSNSLVQKIFLRRFDGLQINK